MKNGSLLLLLIYLCFSCFCQKPKVTWGDEFKLRKGSTDLDVVYSDKSGVYLQESHLALKSYFVIGASARTSATLIKLDKNLSEVYRNNFNKELKGKEFEQFFVLQDKVFIVASVTNRRDKTLDIFTAEVDKNSGELSGEWQPLTTFQKDEKKDNINFKISYNADSSKIIVVSSIEGREKNTYQVQEFDKGMKASKAVTISNEFDPKTFQLEDVLYTINRKIILVGRIYEYQEGRKKKDKFLDFVNYNVRVYDETGKQQNEISTNINSKWLISTKLVMEKDKDLVLAAFYSKAKRGNIDGMLVQRIDANTGKVISTSEKEINNSLLTNAAEDDNANDDADHDEESRAERKEREKLDKIKDEGEGFSRYMQFRNIFYTPDNGLIILAEKYHNYTYTTQSYSPGTNGMPGRWTTTTYSVYECGDLMMCKTDATGNISWLQILPKQQREVIQTGSNSGYSGMSYSFFYTMNMPFYAGFGAIQSNDNINIILNDNPKNSDVLRPGQKVKSISRFSKSDCFVLSVNQATGKLTRNMFFSNTGNPTAMPRLGSVIGNEMYMVGKEDRIFGKTKIAIARINVK